jgi:uncharacterized protein YwqG
MDINHLQQEDINQILSQLLKETEIPYMKLTLTETKPEIWESKVGGLGYVPHGGQIPTDKKGFQLQLLAQIACSQITLEDFPHTGLLQFWVRNDDLAGADFDDETNQDGFRICYYEEVDKTVTEEEVREKVGNNLPFGEDLFPVMGCYGISFSERSAQMTVFEDCHFESRLQELVEKQYPEQAEALLEKIEDNIDDYLEKCNSEFGHKIGGYPNFTQWDPRHEDDRHDILLFQLDSEFGNGTDRILWGDMGVANFFINREKLRHCDFSDVLYNWDCY